MSKLLKRFAAIVACVAVVGAVDMAELRFELANGLASGTLRSDCGSSTPAELGLCRASARLFASIREQRLDTVHPVIAGSSAVGPSADRGTRVGLDSIVAVVAVPLRPRGDRGPPSPVRS